MTIDRMDLMALIEKGADADFLREMIEVISNRLMEMEVEGLTGTSAMAIARGRGRLASVRSTRPSRNSGRAATSRPSWSLAARPRRR